MVDDRTHALLRVLVGEWEVWWEACYHKYTG